jgi:ATP-dependent DNA helicase RecQ
MRERFGMTLVAQVLKGSANKRIAQLSLDKLPTYGLMRAKTEREIFDLIQLLVADGYLTLTEGQYPVVKLLPRAAGVLKGEERVVRKTRKVTRQRQAGDDVFEELRALRKSIADRDRIPPYVVFADSTLRDMAVRLPQTPDELLEVKGVGQAKLDKYGDEFLALLRKLAAAAPSS